MGRITKEYKTKDYRTGKQESYINIGGETIYPFNPKKTSLVQCAISRLYKYEETGLEPEDIKEMIRKYAEKCGEAERLREEIRHIRESGHGDLKKEGQAMTASEIENLADAEAGRLGVGSVEFLERHMEIMEQLERMGKKDEL